MEDIKHLAEVCQLDLDILKTRYDNELRPIAIGPVKRHDQTRQLWSEAIGKHRRNRGGVRFEL